MVEVKIELAKEFLKNLKKNDKVAIIHHDDADGFVSAILLYDFLKNKGIKNIGHFCFYSGGNQEKIIEKIKSYGVVLITDLAPNYMLDILESIKLKKVLYIDHHQKDVDIPEKILEYRTESKISASRSAFAMVGGKRWLEISALLSDVGYSFPEYKDKIEGFAKEEGMEIQEFLKKYYFRIDLFLAYFYKDIDSAFDILKDTEDLDSLRKYSDVVEKEMEKITNDYENKKEKLGRFNYYFFECKYPIKSRVTTNLSLMYPDETFVFVCSNVKKEGSYAVSARDQSGEVDCAELLKKTTKGFEDSSAGGHKKAAGGHILKKDLEEFKERLKNVS